MSRDRDFGNQKSQKFAIFVSKMWKVSCGEPKF